MAASVEKEVAAMAGPTIAVGFTLPYWLRYAMILTGISCKDEIFRMRKSHISSLAQSLGSFSREARLFIAFSPAGVAAQPSPRKFAAIFSAIYRLASCPCGIPGKRK